MKKIICLIAALILIAGCQSATTKSGTSSVIEISSDDLRKEFSKAKDGFYSKYNGKELVVSGKVHSIESGEQTALKFGNAFGEGELKGVPAVYCQSHEKTPKAFDEVKENSEVKVRGYFFVQDDREFFVMKGCQIAAKVENKQAAPITETLDAATLAREYAKSKVEFIDKYYGKELTVKGTLDVAMIRDSPDQVSYTDIKAGSIDEKDLPFVTCWVDFQHKKNLEPLKTGDAVTMKGRLFISKRLHPGSDTLELLGCDISLTK